MFSSTTSARGLVDKATADEDAPTPGYLYNDLAKATFRSLKDCQTVEDQLLTRLTKNVPPAVKLKCLRVAKHCVLKGEISFKRDLQRRLGPIRACLEYRGPPDPIHGDAVYRQIREEAQELMNAIFDTEDKERSRMSGAESAVPPSLAFGASDHSESDSSPSGPSRITDLFSSLKSFASPTSSGSGSPHNGADASFSRQAQGGTSFESVEGGAGTEGRKLMQGMGNTDYNPHHHVKHEKEGLMAKLWRVGDTMVGGGPGASTSNLSHGAFQGSYHSPTLGLSPQTSAGGGYVPGVSPTTERASADGFREGDGEESLAVENIWERGDREWRSSASPLAHGDQTASLLDHNSQHHTDVPQHVGGCDDREAYVQQLVNEVILPGGVRVAPPASVLAQFCLRCESLSADQRLCLYGLIHDKLSSDSPSVQQRALHVVAGLFKRRVDGAIEFFAAHNQPLRTLTSSPIPASRAKAAEIMAVLAPSTTTTTTTAGAAANGGARSLQEVTPGSPLETSVRTHLPSALFAGLSVNGNDARQPESPASLLCDDPLDALLGPFALSPASGSQQSQSSAATSLVEEQLHSLSLSGTQLPSSSAAARHFSTLDSSSSSPFDSAFPFIMGAEAATASSSSAFLGLGPQSASAGAQPGSYTGSAPSPLAFGPVGHGMAYVAVPAGMTLYTPAGGIVYAAPHPSSGSRYAPLASSGGDGGFSFISGSSSSGSGGNSNEVEDSFSFVKDEMKAKAAPQHQQHGKNK